MSEPNPHVRVAIAELGATKRRTFLHDIIAGLLDLINRQRKEISRLRTPSSDNQAPEPEFYIRELGEDLRPATDAEVAKLRSVSRASEGDENDPNN